MARHTLGTRKVEGPSTSLKFLGITLDTIQMETRLPANRLQRTRELVSSWLFKTKREILSLTGVLQHATRIVQPGRTLLSRMYTTVAKLRELHFYTRSIRSSDQTCTGGTSSSQAGMA